MLVIYTTESETLSDGAAFGSVFSVVFGSELLFSVGFASVTVSGSLVVLVSAVVEEADEPGALIVVSVV